MLFRSGVLRKLDDTSVVVEAQDTRVITLKRTENTRFLKDGKQIKPANLKPGDHLVVESKQDEQGFLTAVNVVFQKEGTPEERAAAAAPVDVIGPPPRGGDDDERPVLRRRTQPAPESATAQPQPEEAEADRPAPPPKIRSLPQQDQDPAPVLKRRKPGERRASTPAPAPVESAAAAPPPPEPAREIIVEDSIVPRQDPTIEKAREIAATFTETLPNYYCQELIARFINTSHKTNWQAQDVVSAEVIFEDGRERYRNIKIDGKVAKKSMEELPGAWSTGEFGSVLADLFSTATAADFVFAKDDKASGLPARVYDFAVERSRSHWRIQAASQAISPAYAGSIWIDSKSHRVLRIEMEAKELPREFPFDKVESAVDYQYVRLGGEVQFLLPVHGETLSCQRGTSLCSRNVIDFRNYHKYTSESSITFEK